MSIAPDQDIVVTDVVSVSAGAGDASKLPQLNASGELDDTIARKRYANGVTTKALGDANGATQVITHNMGKAAKRIRIFAILGSNSTLVDTIGTYVASAATYAAIARHILLDSSAGTSDASSSYLARIYQGATAYQQCTVTSNDANSFTLTWAKTSTPSGTANIIWDVES